MIKEKIINILKDILIEIKFDDKVLEHMNLVDDLGIDSITFITLIIELENSFDINIPDKYLLLDKMNTVDKIQMIISNELLKKEPTINKSRKK